jgi:hypothetical protein
MSARRKIAAQRWHTAQQKEQPRTKMADLKKQCQRVILRDTRQQIG